MQEYWITAESFGADLPKNWKEIADYLNAIIREWNLETNQGDVNAVWEAYWQGEYADAPVMEL